MKNPLYQGYCVRCFIHNFPDNEIVRNYRVKERYFTDVIKREFPDIFLYDKTVKDGCSLRRPDAYADLLTHVVLIEIDEDDHEYRDTLCEITKINEIYTDFGDRFNVLIRVNPDKYVDKKGEYHESCFTPCKRTGALIVKDREELTRRQNRMVRRIRHWMKPENIPDDKPMVIESLYSSPHVVTRYNEE